MRGRYGRYGLLPLRSGSIGRTGFGTANEHIDRRVEDRIGALRVGQRPGDLDVRGDAGAFEDLAIDLQARDGHVEQIAARHGEGARGADGACRAGADQRTLPLALVGMHEQLARAARVMIDEDGGAPAQRGCCARGLGLVARAEQRAARVEQVEIARGGTGRAADLAAHIDDQAIERRGRSLSPFDPSMAAR